MDATDAVSPERRPFPWKVAGVLVAAIFLAYARVWHCGFIWDDDDHLTRNPCIVGPLGFADIWTSAHAVYYPLVLASFWIQHAIWGLWAMPYHVVDVALHALCTVLLWRVLERMQVRGALLGAALWGLHPVQVESAAWITEQKNTQSGVFYLLAVLFFLKWRTATLDFEAGARRGGFPRSRAYGAALLCTVLAILSKSSTVMLPAVLALCWWWMEAPRRGDLRWALRHCVWLGPFFAISAAASAWTIWEQKYANHALGIEWGQSWAQRALIGGKDVWFYLSKLAWPHPLTFIYPVWNTDPARPWNFAGLVAVALVTICLFMMRGGKLRPIFLAWIYFLVSLFPVMSFFNVYFFRYSFVGDHFQYLASMGPLALAGSGIATVCSRPKISRTAPALCAGLVAVLGALTFYQTRVYENLETLWRCTLADNPDAWIAHFNLASVLIGQGKLNDAADQLEAQLKLRPDSEEGLGNLANVRVLQGRYDDAIAEFNELLRQYPDSAEGHGNLAAALLRENRVVEAIPHAEQAVELSRHTDESGEGHNDAAMLQILSIAYTRANRVGEAEGVAKMALQRAESQRNGQLATTLRREIKELEARGAGKPPKPGQ